jgi:hypothetical protein
MTKVKIAADLPRAYAEARAVDPIVFANASSAAMNTPWACCTDAALPSIRIQPATEFYDYQAKYFRNDTQYHCPSGFDAAAEAELQAAALAAFRVTDCSAGAASTSCARRLRQVLFHRDQHHSGHDRSQPGAHGGAPSRHRLRRAGVAGTGNQFYTGAQMNANWLMRRNRFKKTPLEKAPRKWPEFVTAWRTYARRAGCCVAVGGGLAGSPGRSIVRCGSSRWTAAFSASLRVKSRRPSRRSARRASCRPISTASSERSKRLPWVEHARIQRRWPNSLHVTVIEQTAAARWGESGLLNTRGELFVKSATHVPAELPH